MLVPLLLGCLTIFISMGIQIVAVVFMLQYLMKIAAKENRKFDGMGFNAYVISMV